MLLSRFVVRILSIGTMVLAAAVVYGQTYPNKPIRIVTGSAGSSIDFISRVIAPGLSSAMGQSVIVDNRPVIGAEYVYKTPPDGYTLLLIGTSELESLLRERPYHIVRDFAPITLATTSPDIVVVHPSLPVKSVKQLIAFAKARPGQLNYPSGGVGTTTHLAGALFASMAKVNMVHVPYKGSAPAISALVSGEMQLCFADIGGGLPQAKSGRLRALAVTSALPFALLPDLPTVAASLPGYEFALMVGIFAPVKTPAAIIDQLNRESVRVLNRADVKEKLFNVGIETVGSSPEELAAAIRSEMDKIGKLIKDAGIKAD